MKIQILFLLLACGLATCEHLTLGTLENYTLIHHTDEKYYAIPFTTREKNYFYNSEEQRKINAIMAYDNLHSKASATVTAGGINHTFVNLRLKSEQGVGLDYDIGIYA